MNVIFPVFQFYAETATMQNEHDDPFFDIKKYNKDLLKKSIDPKNDDPVFEDKKYYVYSLVDFFGYPREKNLIELPPNSDILKHLINTPTDHSHFIEKLQPPMPDRTHDMYHGIKKLDGIDLPFFDEMQTPVENMHASYQQKVTGIDYLSHLVPANDNQPVRDLKIQFDQPEETIIGRMISNLENTCVRATLGAGFARNRIDAQYVEAKAALDKSVAEFPTLEFKI